MHGGSQEPPFVFSRASPMVFSGDFHGSDVSIVTVEISL
jgi:hypothetical protein